MDPLVKYVPSESGTVDISENTSLYYELWKPKIPPKGKIVMIMGVCATMMHFQRFANHLVKCGYQVLLFDHAGTGRSKTNPKILRKLKYTTADYAKDTLYLLNSIWREDKVHVFGVSFGGMVAQKLALILLGQDRLQSLFIANSTLCLGKWMQWIPRFCFRMFAKFNKPTPQKMVKQTFHKEFLEKIHPEAGFTYGKLIGKRWDDEFDQWFNFENDLSESLKFHASANHYLNNQEIEMLQKVVTSVWIAVGDPVIPSWQQKNMASKLDANRYEIRSGLHTIGDFEELSKFLAFLTHHLDSSSVH
ncbi:hypothetical protein HDV04_005752 [Boothiomyces sp. JEL0838]|nr:hypothetical protein HDV04_005752 [Boothiomyces sp. JEL0838]